MVVQRDVGHVQNEEQVALTHPAVVDDRVPERDHRPREEEGRNAGPEGSDALGGLPDDRKHQQADDERRNHFQRQGSPEVMAPSGGDFVIDRADARLAFLIG